MTLAIRKLGGAHQTASSKTALMELSLDATGIDQSDKHTGGHRRRYTTEIGGIGGIERNDRHHNVEFQVTSQKYQKVPIPKYMALGVADIMEK